jgi:hypothetical protein
MKHSNVATYSGVYTEIRKIFGGLEETKRKGLSPKHNNILGKILLLLILFFYPNYTNSFIICQPTTVMKKDILQVVFHFGMIKSFVSSVNPSNIRLQNISIQFHNPLSPSK